MAATGRLAITCCKKWEQAVGFGVYRKLLGGKAMANEIAPTNLTITSWTSWVPLEASLPFSWSKLVAGQGKETAFPESCLGGRRAATEDQTCTRQMRN